METPETPVNYVPPAEPTLVISQEAQYYLQQAGKWATFIAIMGFIGCALLLLVAVFASTFLSLMSKFSPNQNPAAAGALSMMGPAIGIVYFLIALVMFFINLNLYQFGANAKRGIAFGDSVIMTKAFDKLKSFLKIKGIILIVVISLYLLVIVGVVVAGIGASSALHH